ncbi:hypothetical protein ACF044_16495 [Microbacterium sp. NPDC016588]|uniref:hypothetical protein n=1 Tax=Microbacterium TaxID=33882 RepID=UPI0007F3CAD7|nr:MULTISPECIES: hypothetical protein [unclassified Microbacterium]OAN39357.1 hypothetical protein A4X16_14615 [Microbacterium sp. H83]TCJ21214.1 hypothetical protein E0W80_17340 [Microbacterium sp. PI-1]
MNDRTTPTVTVTIQVPSNAPEDVISRVTALGTELGAQGGIDQVLLDLVRTCHVCGCTDERACFGGCWWANDEGAADLCSSCADGPRQ